MKKEASIVFQINFNDFNNENTGKANRHLALYRQLRKNRSLARFCREAFIEKASRHLNGLENSYHQLDSLIKAKGVPYILDSIREKETQRSQSDWNELEQEDILNELVLVKGISTETSAPPLEQTIDLSRKPDLKKLKGLL